MKKVISHLLLVIFLLSALIFFVLLNIKLSALSPAKTKSIATESNFYSFAASFVKDNIVKSSNLALNQGSNFELLNQSITADSVKPTIDGVIDQLFEILNGSNSRILIPVKISSTASDSTNFTFEKNINLTDNVAFGILKKLDILLVALGLLALITLLLAAALAGGINQKLRRFGLVLIFLTIILASICAVMTFAVPHYLPALIAKTSFFQDGKLVNGLQKLITVALSRQTIYYIIEVISIFIIGIVAMFIAKAETKEKSQITDQL